MLGLDDDDACVMIWLWYHLTFLEIPTTVVDTVQAEGTKATETANGHGVPGEYADVDAARKLNVCKA